MFITLPLKISNRKAQAATELAILGSVVIIAFAFLVNYSEKLNRQQANIQQTFRAVLKEAREANNVNGASYTKVVFRRMANVATPMELGQLQSFSSNSTVLWADGLNEEEHGTAKYQFNDEIVPYTSRDVPEEGTTETFGESYTNEVDVTTTFGKTEAGGNIVTTKALNAKDTLDAEVYVNGEKHHFTQALGADGKYYPVNTSLERSRDMQ